MAKANFNLPDILSLVLVLAVVALLAFALRWFLVFLHVPRTQATAISSVLGILTGLYLIAFFRAMQNP